MYENRLHGFRENGLHTYIQCMPGWAAKATHGVRPRATTFGANGAKALGRAALTPQLLADTDKE